MRNIVFKNIIRNSRISLLFGRLKGALLVAILIFSSYNSIAQEDELGTEVVNIVKPYTPTISDAFKVKETPVLNDSITTNKKAVEYSIFSVPVASTFTPAKGKAATVEKVKPMKLYDNYATLGFGNYTTILGELYSNFEISRTDNAGFFFRHNSAQGDIDGVRVDNKFYDTSLDVNYSSRQKDVTYRLDAGAEHQLFNYYGFNDFFNTASDEFLNAFDINQSYFSGYVGGSLAIEDSFFEKLSANIRYTGDSYASSEIDVKVLPEFSFPVSDFTLKVDGDVEYLSGNFDRMYLGNEGIKYSYLNAGILPSLVYVDKDFTVSLGVGAFLGLDNENSNTDFFIYPRINASYRLIDELLIVYGGTEGDLVENTYYGFKELNPYVSPTLTVVPTSKLYDAFGGLKGKLSNSIGYNVRASFANEENKALFRLNTYSGMLANSRGYEQGNSFQVVYDDLKTLSVFGELKVEVTDMFALGVNGTFNSYNTSSQAEAWNLPDLKLTVFSNFNITEEIYGGASVFYVGKRKDLLVDNSTFIAVPVQTEIELDAYLDLNLHLGYKVSDRLSIFAKGSNL